MRSQIIFLLSFIPFFVCAEDDFMADFILGKYLLVGKGVDTQHTYTGKITIYREDKALKLTRVIDGNTTVGDVAFEPALSGDTKVIRMRFKQAEKSYEETCLWQSDLDNYARISCYLYHPGGDSRDPGMEVMFYDHSAD